MMTTATSTAPVTDQPAPKTQIDTVRAHLMTGATITTWDAYRLYQITCLAQRIHDLRTAGLTIQSEIVIHNDKRFSVYWLDEQTLLESELSNSEVNP
ncbi:helix-turn-helix domain-containing protein [Psychrobacter sp. ASPA161_6]|uniref:helix-turn-helix domain-containing protein n=1 Tax=Psychrobacter sp. ASPA161_6 TaxID=3160962 RepID=UPI003F7D175C